MINLMLDVSLLMMLTSLLSSLMAYNSMILGNNLITNTLLVFSGSGMMITSATFTSALIIKAVTPLY